MKKPVILISAKDPEYYVNAIEGAGGIAVAEQWPKPCADGYDGLLLSGGCDIDPSRYGEEINGAVHIDTERDIAEFALIDVFVKAGKPVMGICRGCQLTNVYFGGSLYQHLCNADSHVRGNIDTDALPSHNVTACEDSVLASLYGTVFAVNSSHHQAAKELGTGLIATVMCGDVVEAVEHESLPVIAVQWHPERMLFGMRRDDAVDGMPLFEHFISLCCKRD